jgi:hypothetical protein
MDIQGALDKINNRYDGDNDLTTDGNYPLVTWVDYSLSEICKGLFEKLNSLQAQIISKNTKENDSQGYNSFDKIIDFCNDELGEWEDMELPFIPNNLQPIARIREVVKIEKNKN